MLAKKLFIKPNTTFTIIHAPDGFEKKLLPLPDGSKQEKRITGSPDLVLVFVKMKKELEAEWAAIRPKLKNEAILWIAYPKKSSGLHSDLAMMNENWDLFMDSPWQPVSMISVDETWTGVRFRFLPGKEKERAVRTTENIFDRDGSLCIDRQNRIVNPPVDLQRLLNKKPKAQLFFDQLSFTNKKEYVVWIIDAKRAETRSERLLQAMDKLSKTKKNPAEK